MQIFEQYGVSEGACQFALAALEQVDVLNLSDGNNDDDLLPEPATTIRGRLWANVFKFTLDMKQYGDAYCAIISNPDEDSKYICLRRFVIVLCELGEAKVIPFSYHSTFCCTYHSCCPCHRLIDNKTFDPPNLKKKKARQKRIIY